MAINRTPSAPSPAAAPGKPATEAVAAPPRVTPPTPGTAAAAKPAVLYRLPSGLQGTFICAVEVGGGTRYSFATGGKPELLEAGTAILEVPTASVVPPDAPPRVSKRHNIVDEVPPSPPAIEQAQAAPAPAVVPEKPVTEENAQAAKRGRPAGSKNKPKTEVIETPQGAVVAVDLSGVKVEVTPAAQPAPADVRLYFGCAPVGVVTQSLYAHMEALESLVIRTASQNGASAMIEGDDLRLADGQTLGFGRWAAYLAEAAKSMLPPPGHYVVDLGADSRVDCVANAIARALPEGAVVRGVR